MTPICFTPANALGKPRFDAGLAAAIRAIRRRIALTVEVPDGKPQAFDLSFRGDGSDGILFVLAHAVCTALAAGSLRRIRRCSGQACGRYFTDETKNGSRRWCSLRCMERARVPRRRTIVR